jgi:hypothetical protein
MAVGMKKTVRKNERPNSTPLTSIASASETANVRGTMKAVKMTIVRSDVRKASSPRMFR